MEDHGLWIQHLRQSRKVSVREMNETKNTWAIVYTKEKDDEKNRNVNMVYDKWDHSPSYVYDGEKTLSDSDLILLTTNMKDYVNSNMIQNELNDLDVLAVVRRCVTYGIASPLSIWNIPDDLCTRTEHFLYRMLELYVKDVAHELVDCGISYITTRATGCDTLTKYINDCIKDIKRKEEEDEKRQQQQQQHEKEKEIERDDNGGEGNKEALEERNCSGGGNISAKDNDITIYKSSTKRNIKTKFTNNTKKGSKMIGVSHRRLYMNGKQPIYASRIVMPNCIYHVHDDYKNDGLILPKWAPLSLNIQASETTTTTVTENDCPSSSLSNGSNQNYVFVGRVYGSVENDEIVAPQYLDPTKLFDFTDTKNACNWVTTETVNALLSGLQDFQYVVDEKTGFMSLLFLKNKKEYYEKYYENKNNYMNSHNNYYSMYNFCTNNHSDDMNTMNFFDGGHNDNNHTLMQPNTNSPYELLQKDDLIYFKVGPLFELIHTFKDEYSKIITVLNARDKGFEVWIFKAVNLPFVMRFCKDNRLPIATSTPIYYRKLEVRFATEYRGPSISYPTITPTTKSMITTTRNVFTLKERAKTVVDLMEKDCMTVNIWEDMQHNVKDFKDIIYTLPPKISVAFAEECAERYHFDLGELLQALRHDRCYNIAISAAQCLHLMKAMAMYEIFGKHELDLFRYLRDCLLFFGWYVDVSKSYIPFFNSDEYTKIEIRDQIFGYPHLTL